jgi:hypothetical protein
VRKIALDNGGKVDFACMPQYRSLIPLIAGQSYIDKALVIEDWQCTGSPYGDQPWQSPKQEGYDKQLDLTYREHPYGEFLADNIARRQGVELKNVIPFIDVSKMDLEIPTVVYQFNGMHSQEKSDFLDRLFKRLFNIAAINLSTFSWESAASALKGCICFIGCRSSAHVLAHAVGAKVLIFEPNTARNSKGPWAKVFCCPYGQEIELTEVSQADLAVNFIEKWRDTLLAGGQVVTA